MSTLSNKTAADVYCSQNKSRLNQRSTNKSLFERNLTLSALKLLHSRRLYFFLVGLYFISLISNFLPAIIIKCDLFVLIKTFLWTWFFFQYLKVTGKLKNAALSSCQSPSSSFAVVFVCKFFYEIIFGIVSNQET